MYVSTVAKSLPEKEFSAISRRSSKNNRKIGVTGILLSAHEFFFKFSRARRLWLIGCWNEFVAIPATGT